MTALHTDPPGPPRASPLVAPGLVWLAAFAVFAGAAYPTITWWDSSSYSLAAATLGVTQPPGSLLLTLLGWAVSRVPTGLATAHLLNLLAGALAATTVALVLVVALRLLRRPEADAGERARRPSDAGATTDRPPGGDRPGGTSERLPALAIAGAALGALSFAFSPTPWQYAVQFTPYVLTGAFTALILWTLARWWSAAEDPGSWRWLLLLGLLFGLDYSVHRTNALLVPGAVAWILIRAPRTALSARAWVAGAAGLLAGAAAQLLIIPIAAAHPVFDFGDPSSWQRFRDYESLAQFGGGWLVQFWPRHAALWSVQAMDLVRAFGANFLWLSGPWAAIGPLVALLGVLGLVALWRRERRLAAAFAVLLALHAVLTVAYFNIPARFFRPFDRHYLPVFTTWAVLGCVGAGAIAGGLRERGGRRGSAVRWAAALLVLAPLAQLARNWRAEDGARRTFTEDFAANLLRGLPPGAILFTWGDNDTFPAWYVQAVEHVRPDVAIVNLSLTNTAWYLDELLRKDPTFPLPRGFADSHGQREWVDSTVVIPVAGTAAQSGLPEGTVLPRAIPVRVAPTIAGKYVLLQDLVLLQVLETNRWRRPLCFAATGPYPGLAGLAPYARLDGLFWRLVPLGDPPADREVLRRNLLETHVYRGYADPALPLDDVSRYLGQNHYRALESLLRAEATAGEGERCRRTRETVLRALPLARLEPEAAVGREIAAACEGAR